MKMEDVIKAYITLRNEKDAIEGEVKDKVKAIKEKMVKLEAYIKKQADEQGVTSFKTGYSVCNYYRLCTSSRLGCNTRFHREERSMGYVGEACS